MLCSSQTTAQRPSSAPNSPPQNRKTNSLYPSRIYPALGRLGLGLGLALTLTALSVLPGSVSPAAANSNITGVVITTNPTFLIENDTATTITITATWQSTSGTEVFSVDKTLNISIGTGHPFLPDATLNTDFTVDSTNNAVTIPANATSATTTITAKIDTTIEGKEYFSISVPVSEAPNNNPLAAWPYIDDAIPYALSVSTSLLNEADGSTDITVTATKTSGTAPSTATTVTLTLGGTAVEDTDYDATIPSFTIPANTNSATATLTIDPLTTDATLNECEETIVVSGTTDTAIILTPTTILLNDDKTPCFAGSSVIDTHVFYSSQSSAQTATLPTATPSGVTYTLTDPADHTRPTWLTFNATTPSLSVTNATAADSVCYTLTASKADSNSVTHTATHTACVAVVEDVCSSTSGWHPKDTVTSELITPNAGLIRDCNILMAAKDTLAGTSTALNWATDVRMWDNAGTTWKTALDGTADGVSYLWVLNIHLNGTLPGVLGGLAKPTQLDFFRNKAQGSDAWATGDLSGAIPKELGSLTSLTSLLLRHNKLSGTIPPELGNLKALAGLELPNNQLTSPLPQELSQLSRLTRLLLRKNNLTGTVPEWLAQLTELKVLYLSDNDLTGKIPKVLSTLPNLEVLNL